MLKVSEQLVVLKKSQKGSLILIPQLISTFQVAPPKLKKKKSGALVFFNSNILFKNHPPFFLSQLFPRMFIILTSFPLSQNIYLFSFLKNPPPEHFMFSYSFLIFSENLSHQLFFPFFYNFFLVADFSNTFKYTQGFLFLKENIHDCNFNSFISPLNSLAPT
jgi:hypothetical protein